MMGRPWVKLATKVYTDPKMLRLPRDVFGNFCMILAMAGASGDDGCAGTVDDVAFMLHIAEEDVRRVVDLLEGRLLVDDAGHLWVRDWSQWQAPARQPEPAEQVTERSRRWRESQRNANGAATLALQPSNDGATAPLEVEVEGEVEREAEEEPETATPPPIVGGAAATAASVPADAEAEASVPENPVPKREQLGPGGKLYRRLTRVSPNLEQRPLLEAAYERHGSDRMEQVIRDWLLKGYRKQNVKGMLNVLEVGWTRRASNGRAIRPVPPEEAAAIDAAVAAGVAEAEARFAKQTPDPAAETLDSILAALQGRGVPAGTFNAWFKPVQPVALVGDVLTVRAPNDQVESWIRQRGMDALVAAAAEVAPGISVELVGAAAMVAAA